MECNLYKSIKPIKSQNFIGRRTEPEALLYRALHALPLDPHLDSIGRIRHVLEQPGAL